MLAAAMVRLKLNLDLCEGQPRPSERLRTSVSGKARMLSPFLAHFATTNETLFQTRNTALR